MKEKIFKKQRLNDIYNQLMTTGKYEFSSNKELKNFHTICRIKGLPYFNMRGLTIYRDKEDAKKEKVKFPNRKLPEPKNPIVISLISRFKSGEKLTHAQILKDYFDSPENASEYHRVFFVSKHIMTCRKFLKREGLFIGWLDGKYQLLQEETYQPDSYRRYKGLQGQMKNVQDQIMHGIEVYSGNPELVNQLELLILNLSDAVNNERRKLLTVKMNNEQS